MRKIAAIAIGLALLGAAGSTSVAHAQEASSPTNNASTPTMVTVQHGNTLSGIAEDYNTTSTRLFNANDAINDPDLIFPGEQIRIPAESEQLPDRTVSSDAANQTASVQTVSTTASAAAAVPASADTSVWDRIAACESSGNWAINTGNGFYGGLQFTLSSWQLVGGSGLPSNASREEQIARATSLQAIQGWGAWPVCSLVAGMSY